jgi:crotonobetainyl-CoA:carnitine CoA-transferase CaiB-like acyl-CoA transferase
VTALSDLRLIDLSTNIAGPFCTKLFADFGADVVKVESTDQVDEARALGPFSGADENPEASGMFLYLNTNKRSVTLNLDSEQGKTLLRELAATADVVVESFPPGTMERIGLGFDALQDIRPGIVLTSVTPFGQSGPWRDYQATDLVQYAASGLSYINGVPEREPLKEPGYESDYQAGVCAFAGAMTAVCHRDVGGPGRHVDVSILEAATSTLAPQLLMALHSGVSSERRAMGLPTGLVPCKDGYVFLNVRHEQTWQQLWRFFDEPQLANDPRFATAADRRKRSRELEDFLAPRLARYTMEELYHGLSDLRILVGMALDIPHLMDDSHLRERDFFVTSQHLVAGELSFPGAPFKMSKTPWMLVSPAPLNGEHNEEIYTGLLGHTSKELDNWRSLGDI